MLTHRWAILRRAVLAVNIRIVKTIALVILALLAKLHNYCINANNNDISANTARDKRTSEINGAVPLVPVEDHGEGS
jgi:type IV secretory pathway component VirB8